MKFFPAISPYHVRCLVLSLPLTCCAIADELPARTPSQPGRNAHHAPTMTFTTKAYQAEALRLVLQEVNSVAQRLGLAEQLPITQSNIVKAFINPFGYAHARKAIGNITTKSYTYYVSRDNKFSYLEGVQQDAECRRYQKLYTWPLSQLDTNQASNLALEWLAAVPVDVQALSRDCAMIAAPEKDYVQPPQGRFVPVYYIHWRKRQGDQAAVADVRLFTPTKTLLQLRVEDPKYILRPPLVFTNLSFLLSQTNAPPQMDSTPRR